MSISTFDPTKIRARAGELYIAAYPTTAPTTATTPTAMTAAYFDLFYVNGSIKKVLDGGTLPFAVADAKGLVYDAKYKSLTFDPALGLPINAGKYLESANGEIEIGDVSVAKFIDLLSLTSNESVTIAATSVQAAKSGALIGTTPFNNRYVMMYRWPSLYAGEWDHLLIPRVTFSPDIKLEFTKTKPQTLKVSLMAESDLYLLSPDSGMYAAAYFEETTAAHS